MARKPREILDAARHLMLQRGPGGVTMEAIAREAGVAKATLYRYFADRDAVLGAILETLIDEVEAAFRAGLARPGPADARAAAALQGKHATVRRLLQGSPHA